MLPSTIRSALVTLCLATSITTLTAQTFTIPLITFEGAPAYSQTDLLKVTGLTPGSTSTQEGLQAAAQHLGDTGLFSDINFASNEKGLVFTLKPMPDSNLLPASFANFVWWSSDQINSALKTAVPLYTGVIPLTGNLQDSVIAALKAMLATKGVATANIVAIPASTQAGSTASSIRFEIESPQIRVHSIVLHHVSPLLQTQLDKVVKEHVGKPFAETTTPAEISSQLTEIYRNDGYLDATVVDITHAPPKATPTGIDIDLVANISEGAPYHVSQLTWEGSDIMSTDAFNKQAKLKPEDLASQAALKETLAPLAHAYYVKGFQDARIQAPATLDAATHQVAYTISVIPGPQYRIKTILTVGLSEEQRKQFASAWHMNAGDFYDVTYLTEFLHKNSALQSLAGYSATYDAVADPNTHLVDLTITFAKGGVLN
jgi:outer membrane protein insertion porin family